MPIWTRGWGWFAPRMRSASGGLKAAFVALGLLAAFCYVFFGLLIFDAGYWALGKIARTQADRRLRVGVPIALVAVYLLVLVAAGSTAPKTSAEATPGPVVTASVTSQPSAVAATASPAAPTVAATAMPTTAPTEPPATPTPTAPPATPEVTAAPSLTVTITGLPPSVAHGANATLSAHTSPSASCTPMVVYASGNASTSTSLVTKTANSSGNVTWTWKVGSNTGPGTSTATVTCTLGSDSNSASKDFEVT
jgi:micrococcal nuclease